MILYLIRSQWLILIGDYDGIIFIFDINPSDCSVEGIGQGQESK